MLERRILRILSAELRSCRVPGRWLPEPVLLVREAECVSVAPVNRFGGAQTSVAFAPAVQRVLRSLPWEHLLQRAPPLGKAQLAKPPIPAVSAPWIEEHATIGAEYPASSPPGLALPGGDEPLAAASSSRGPKPPSSASISGSDGGSASEPNSVSEADAARRHSLSSWSSVFPRFFARAAHMPPPAVPVRARQRAFMLARRVAGGELPLPPRIAATEPGLPDVADESGGAVEEPPGAGAAADGAPNVGMPGSGGASAEVPSAAVESPQGTGSWEASGSKTGSSDGNSPKDASGPRTAAWKTSQTEAGASAAGSGALHDTAHSTALEQQRMRITK